MKMLQLQKNWQKSSAGGKKVVAGEEDVKSDDVYILTNKFVNPDNLL